MIPHLWELGVLMMERMFNMSVDNAEFFLMSATQLELVILNQWTINQSLLTGQKIMSNEPLILFNNFLKTFWL